MASQVALEVKNLPADAGDVRDSGLIPGSGRSPRGGHGNSLQYSCLENLQDRGAWGEAIVFIGPQRVRHDSSDLAHTHRHAHAYRAYMFNLFIQVL